MEELSRTFRAMNTDVVVIVGNPETLLVRATAAVDEVEKLFEANEAAMSRFRPESELSSLNRSSGKSFRASPLLFEVLRAAIDAARTTHGIFDPTVLSALVTAGYDRSFEFLKADGSDGHEAGGTRRAESSNGPAQGSCSWRDIKLDDSSRSITLPRGCAVDLGGIGKGWTVDQAAAILQSFADFAVDAGGDIYAAGTQRDGSAWTIGVADPVHPDRDLALLAVSDRAVATSTVGKRRWLGSDGREMHHLIDPRTGQPSQGDVTSATVVAESVTRAEVLAKTALLLGSRDGESFLDNQQEIDWMLVLADGDTRRSAGLPEVEYAS